MATKKNTKTKKVTKKAKKFSELQEPNEEEIMQNATEKLDINDVKEAIDSIDFSNLIDEDEHKKIQEKIKETIAPAQEMINNLNEINKSMEALNKEVTNDPAHAKEFIEREMAKAQELKEKMEKIIRSRNYTNTWNGIKY